jgi:uncharacterized protein YbjT (DUF2867 family)
MPNDRTTRTSPTIAVTGATGNVGRPLIDLLLRDGARVRAVTRSPRTAGLPDAVELVEGDPSRPETLATAMQGVTALFLNPVAVRGAAVDLLALARAGGAVRVVALSASTVDDDPAAQPSRAVGVNYRATEDAVEACGLEWVTLRSGAQATNSIRMWAAQIRSGGGVIFGPYAASRAAAVDERDVAAVAARALLTDGLVGARPVLTGPESLTQEQMVVTIGDALGRPLRYQEIPPEVARRAMLDRGAPFTEALVNRLLAWLANGVEHPAPVTHDVETILGRAATTYAQWAVDHAGAFRLDR